MLLHTDGEHERPGGKSVSVVRCLDVSILTIDETVKIKLTRAFG